MCPCSLIFHVTFFMPRVSAVCVEVLQTKGSVQKCTTSLCKIRLSSLETIYSRRKFAKSKNLILILYLENQRQKMFDPHGKRMRRMQLDRIRYTNTELKWKENVKNIGTGDLKYR